MEFGIGWEEIERESKEEQKEGRSLPKKKRWHITLNSHALLAKSRQKKRVGNGREKGGGNGVKEGGFYIPI